VPGTVSISVYFEEVICYFYEYERSAKFIKIRDQSLEINSRMVN